MILEQNQGGGRLQWGFLTLFPLLFSPVAAVGSRVQTVNQIPHWIGQIYLIEIHSCVKFIFFSKELLNICASFYLHVRLH
jgi:hypothetical protein